MKKKALMILSILAGAVVLYSLTWFLNNQIVYNKYEKGFEEIPLSHTKVKMLEDHTLSVKKADYGTFTGNLSITNNEDSVSILIWPSLFGMETGVMITEEGTAYHILVDENFQVIDETDVMGRELMEKHKEEINKQREIANQTWDIF
jgi:hypothetical protein